MTAAVITLLDDWLERRARLEREGTPQGAAYRDVQLRILEYLIKRYAEDPVAQSIARFPAQSGIQFNQRAAVVHAHLLGRPATQTMDDATDRMSPILKRMAAADAQKFTTAPAQGRTVSVHQILPVIYDWLMPVMFVFDDWIIHRAWDCVKQNPQLPEDVIPGLCRKLYDLRVTPILKRCTNESAVTYCADVWLSGNNVAAAEAVLMVPHHRPAALKVFREKLADPNHIVRRRALRMIGLIGGLEDIGLLLDIHALPPQHDESPVEREQILAVVAAITHRVEQEGQPESSGIQMLWR